MEEGRRERCFSFRPCEDPERGAGSPDIPHTPPPEPQPLPAVWESFRTAFSELASGCLTGGPRLRTCSYPPWLFRSVQGQAAFRAGCVLRAPSECLSGGPALQHQAVFLSQHVPQHLFPDWPEGSARKGFKRKGQTREGIPYMWSLKRNDTNELTYKTKRDSQT